MGIAGIMEEGYVLVMLLVTGIRVYIGFTYHYYLAISDELDGIYTVCIV
jgi:hypothetical protein